MSSWVSFILLVYLCFSFNGVSGARHRKKKHPTAVLTGTVYCDTCFRQEVPKSTHLISGATVAVECGSDDEKPRFKEEVKTNEKGEFEAKLPPYVSKNAEKIKACSVRLIHSNEQNCAVAATATSSEIHFKSKKAGTHVFSAGFFTFKPQLCNEKDLIPPTGGGMLPPLPVPDLPIPSLVPPVPQLPGVPLPDLPIPSLVPPVPQLPGVPLPPNTRQKHSEKNKLSDQKTFGFPFPPNPFQPPTLPPLPLVPSPPSIFPPLPFQPPPPSLLPPIFPSPPPASLFPPLPFPPIPSLIPSPPPPPPPAFPIPLPPLPPLIPGFPPVPPASTHQHVGKTNP
ncbi:hypothetical protein HanRHA438_Chr15g0724391 [Helianthus annuus]|uniref:Protodermal factor 1 n=1 Tax=Helianthus annuus TaxID=4232 RepID=A0A251SCL3_HELAN|nr:vegetative cell wall protein gp1 [Helianthus annuus]KAF5766164.1 putative protodermal factor 1 [Helianthus annuus]KAJ0452600.1 hypothetical protein HanHA300_Chr15g0580741 [Helianthus annuus]KAJ0457551.1 hypothetical protein HanIR_Chr15g0774961 [Helianthus annuus]KAJ0474508.1 hypothetical protein HanHA89_Chr15g0630461 [Helianthus annuus]KAJ0650066.1 hypothetical protein HanLR1_Chr15g0591391 [Helianthus annuus]